MLILMVLASKGFSSIIVQVSSTMYEFPLAEETMTMEPRSYYSMVVGYPSSGIYVSVSVEELDRIGATRVGEPPIDVLFMTPEQFESYESAFNKSNGDSNNSFRPQFLLAYLSVTSVEFFLGALNGTGYHQASDEFGPIVLVIENANFTVNGARTRQSITVKFVLGEEKVLLPDEVSFPINVANPSPVDVMLLTVVNSIFSFNTMFPLITGIFGLILGYKGLPGFSSRINRLRRNERPLETNDTKNDD